MSPDPTFMAEARWLPRDESLTELAERWLKVVACLQAIDPLFTHWYIYDQNDATQPLLLELSSVMDALAAAVETDEDGNPLPGTTHRLSVRNGATETGGPQDFELNLVADQNWKYANNFVGLCSPFPFHRQDPALITFDVFREVVLAMGESFEATFAQAFSTALLRTWPQGRDCPDLPPTWISYLGPRYSHLVTPPDTAVAEYRPDGGLLMAATRDVFAMDNPVHMAVANDIARAVAPFNALPRPLAA